MIRVLIVEDSKVIQKILENIFNTDPEMQVVGIANNGAEGVELAKKLQPDIITMDIRMPVMDGFEATQEIMQHVPTPIVVVASSIDEKGLDIPFKAIQAGALHILEKPRYISMAEYEKIKEDILSKIKVLSEVKVVRRWPANNENSKQPAAEEPIVFEFPNIGKPRIVAMASSTGGPTVLEEIFSKLPEDFGLPICLVQHIATGFGEGLVHWLNQTSKLPIKVAKHGEVIEKNTIYFAPEEMQMRVEASGRLLLTQEAAVGGHCPSADVLFESVARQFGAEGVGVILTGMGCDGANGMKLMYDKNGITLAQDEASCLVFGMPKAAIDAGAVEHIVPASSMADVLAKIVKSR